LLSFFKVNDPFRLIGVGIYLIILSVLLLVVFPFPITEPRLLWIILGERLSDGYFLYLDVIDDTGPLSAGFFTLIHWLFGRSEIAYELIGRLLILFQIVYWNSTLLKYRVFEENTYLPAIIMAALFHFSFDMLGLSPALLGSTFLILALGQLFSQTVLQKDTSESILLIGIYGGLAAGFHPNFIIFLPYIIFTGIAISGFSFRQLLLALVGFSLPILLILVFYYWNDGLSEALKIWPMIFGYGKYEYQSHFTWLILGAFPLLLALIGYFYAAVLRGSTINQQKQRQLIVIWLIFSVLEILLIKRQAAFQLLIFVPSLTYLITSFFINIGRGFLGKASFFLLVLALPVAGWWYWQGKTGGNSNYFVNTTGEIDLGDAKKIMILGSDSSPYLKAPLGGPFLNYRLSQTYLESEMNLMEKATLYKNMLNQKPQLVIDSEGVFKSILNDYPILEQSYTQVKPGVYHLKK
jgi:hypothetical protein